MYMCPDTKPIPRPATPPVEPPQVSRGFSEALHSFYTEKVQKVVTKIKPIASFALKCLACAFLYWFNHIPFAVGFFVGFFFPEQVKVCIEKIKKVWDELPIPGKAVIALLSAFELPVAIAVATPIVGAQAGAYVRSFWSKSVFSNEDIRG